MGSTIRDFRKHEQSTLLRLNRQSKNGFEVSLVLEWSEDKTNELSWGFIRYPVEDFECDCEHLAAFEIGDWNNTCSSVIKYLDEHPDDGFFFIEY